MGTDLKNEPLPVVKINFPVGKSKEDFLNSISLLLEFYGIETLFAEEIKENILKMVKYPEKREERFEIEIFPYKDKVEIDLSIKEDNIKKNVIPSFKSKKIEIVKITRSGKKVKIKLRAQKI